MDYAPARNPLVISDAIMEPFAREALQRAAADGQPVVLILDQSNCPTAIRC